MPAKPRSIAVALLHWYDAHARLLPWRAPPGQPAPDPYRVWLSEIMERVNRFFGYAAVARVTIRQGQVVPREKRAAPPSLKPVPVDMGSSLRAIGDPELKAVLAALAAGVATTSGAPTLEERGE